MCTFVYSLSDLYVTPPSASTLTGTVFPPQIKYSNVIPPLAIKLQPNEVNLAKVYHRQFKHYGKHRRIL